MDYRENLARLFDLQKFGMKFGLDSMNRILDKLGRPQQGGYFVHLAGTNGKGSTAAMLTSILSVAGLQVGLYTSPHLVTFRERIRICGELIAEDEVLALTAEVWEATDPKSPPTFFEFVTALAFLYFKRRGVDLVVLETGLGGRFDSTNVIDPVLTGITNVSLEHTEYLGNTVTEIAGEKAGIIKPGKPFVGGRLCPEALSVVLKSLSVAGVQGSLLDRDYKLTVKEAGLVPVIDYKGTKWDLPDVKLGLPGSYQVDNGAMSIALAETLTDLGYDISEEAVRTGLLKVRWPGRAEIFQPGAWPKGGDSRAVLMLDGAHNPDGAQALARFLADLRFDRLHLILGVMADKDVAGVLGPLVKLADRLYLTRPEYSRAATPELLLEKLTSAFGHLSCSTMLYPTIPEAVNEAAKVANPNDLVVVSGSLFTVGETRAWLTGASVVESN